MFRTQETRPSIVTTPAPLCPSPCSTVVRNRLVRIIVHVYSVLIVEAKNVPGARQKGEPRPAQLRFVILVMLCVVFSHGNLGGKAGPAKRDVTLSGTKLQGPRVRRASLMWMRRLGTLGMETTDDGRRAPAHGRRRPTSCRPTTARPPKEGKDFHYLGR